MSLGNQYRVKTERSQFVDHLGVERTTLVFEIPTANIALERANFRASLDNILPGHDSGDVFAPCIHESFVNIDPENRKGKLVTCIYQRPSKRMVLRPGRGMLSFTSYENLRIDEIGVLNTSQRVFVVDEEGEEIQPVSQTWHLDREREQIIDVRTVIVAEVVDEAKYRGTIFGRAISWLGKGGSFGAYSNLKCMKVEIGHRAENAGWLDSKWFFAKREEEWPEAGIIEPEFYAVSMPSGTEIEDFDPDDLPPDLAGDDTGYMSIRLRNQDNDVISGDADFAVIQNYLTWEG